MLLSKFLSLGNFFVYLLELKKFYFTFEKKRVQRKLSVPETTYTKFSFIIRDLPQRTSWNTKPQFNSKSQVAPLNKNFARSRELLEFLLAISLPSPYLVPVSLPLLCKLFHLTVIEVREAAWDEWWEVRSASPAFCHYVTPSSHAGSTTDCLE